MSLTPTAATATATTLSTPATSVATTLTSALASALVTAATYSTDIPSPTDAPDSGTGSGSGSGSDGYRDHRYYGGGSRRSVIVGVISFVLPLTTLVVLLRFYTRHFLSRALGADDWMMLVSLVLAIVDGVTMLLMTTQGLGRHMWTLSAEQIKTYNMYFYLSIVFYYSCLGTVKTAILLQYLRVFAVKMRKITLVALVLIGLWSTALVLVSVLACRPIRGFWDKDVPASCVADLPQWYVNAAGNIATDIIIFTLPLPVLWRLNLPRSQRLSLIGIFCLGFFTCTISVIRITFLNLNGDDTYANVAAACWSIGELCCAIVCSCLPTLRPVFFRLLPAPLRHRNHPSNNYNNNNNNAGNTCPNNHSNQNSLTTVRHSTLGLHDTGGFHRKSVRSADTTVRGSLHPSLAGGNDDTFLRHFGGHPAFGGGGKITGAVDGSLDASKAGLSFTSTSRLRSSNSLTTASADVDVDADARRSSSSSSDSGSDLGRYMQWAGRSIDRQPPQYSRRESDAEKRAAAAATAGAVTASSVPAPPPTPPPVPATPALTPSRRSLRGIVHDLAGPITSSGAAAAAAAATVFHSRRRSSSGARSSSHENKGSSSTETLARTGAVTPGSVSAQADAKGRRVGRSKAPSPASSPQSSAAPTRAHSPAGASTAQAAAGQTSLLPRAYSYSHLRRMAAAVVGGSSNEQQPSTSTPLTAPVISSSAPLNPGDPLAMDRDAYLGLRQGTVTSIEANRPSTAEAEAIGWELPTGPGIQIRREVAQNVGPA